MIFIKRIWPWAVLAGILLAAAWLQISLWSVDPSRSDIYYLYLDGSRLRGGENPYARVLEGNMRENDKYTTYFPAFIGLSYLTQLPGLQEFHPWLGFWRWIFLCCYLGIGGLFFWMFYSRGAPALAVFSTLFWAFNRWTLFIVRLSGMDFIPILLLLLSLFLLPRRRWWALGLFSLSLAFKQIAIFLLPLFLIEIYHLTTKDRGIQMIKAGGVLASAPLLTSLPFLLWNARGYVWSILFSITRDQFQYFQPAASLDMLVGLSGVLARIPMLLLMLVVYLSALWRKTHIYLTAMLVMAVFVGFNAIFFDQYMVWFAALLPLAALPLIEKHSSVSVESVR